MKLNKLVIIGFSSVLLTSVVSAKGKGERKSFEELDADKDGKISEVEFVAGHKDEARAKAHFKKKDKDADGFLSKEEFAKRGGGKKGPRKPREKKEKGE